MKWILILFAHVGPLGTGNSNSLATAVFENQTACVAAGKAAQSLAKNTYKLIEYACVPGG